MADPREKAWAWEKEFAQRRKDSPAARRAWKKIENGGLADPARILLYQYHAFGTSVPAKISEQLESTNAYLTKLKRVDQKARERQDDQRAPMFAFRRDTAHRKFTDQTWPFENEQVKTFADAEVAYKEIRELPPADAPAMIGDARQTLERYGGKMLLAVLRAGAKVHCVELSLTEIVELADAAHPSDPPLDKNVLQRFLKQPEIMGLEQAYQARFEDLLQQLRDSEKPC